MNLVASIYVKDNQTVKVKSGDFRTLKFYKDSPIDLLNRFEEMGIKEIYFVDLKKVLNESKAGKKAQDFLKKKFENESKKFEKEGATIRKEESDLIAKKKIISPEEYKKNLDSLRNKSVNY